MRYLKLLVNSVGLTEDQTNATRRNLSTWCDVELQYLRDDAQKLIDAINDEWAQREMLPHPFRVPPCATHDWTATDGHTYCRTCFAPMVQP